MIIVDCIYKVISIWQLSAYVVDKEWSFAFSDHPNSVVCIGSLPTDPQCMDLANRYMECCECCRAGRVIAVRFGIVNCTSQINEATFGPCSEIALQCCQQSELTTVFL